MFDISPCKTFLLKKIKINMQNLLYSDIADGFKLNVLVDIRQKSHSADYQAIRGPREVGREEEI
jgi:hypothetical protein